ncbi:hypothetical protein EFT57_04345 [Lacticaseibacillus paracasei]|nr:hypothetical protein [Lacticaseibacillus paracasei]QHC82616.1 hypothetical protein F5J09_13250 [Lacticaseibacillus paracasei]RDF81869.1 hypothetical protein DQM24_08520 [Lacticaseibacillus paracasei]
MKTQKGAPAITGTPLTRPLKTVDIRLSNQLRPSNSVKSFSDGLFSTISQEKADLITILFSLHFDFELHALLGSVLPKFWRTLN